MKQLQFSQTIRRLIGDRGVRATLFSFTLSRVIVLALFLLVGLLHTGPDNAPGHIDTYIAVDKIPFSRILNAEVQTADVNWYIDIAEQGYERIPFNADLPRHWAFFPLFPLLLRLASRVTGDFLLTGMALSNICFLLALLLVYRAALLFGLSAEDAERALIYLAFFPTSYFFSVPLPEALFLLLTVASFYFAKSERWWIAGLLAALASATRSTGILLLPALAVLYWEMYRPLRLKDLRKDSLSLLLVPAGLLSFMIYLKITTGNALAFKGAMAAWGREPGFFLRPLLSYMFHPAAIVVHWDFRLLNFSAAVLALICGAVLLKRRQLAFGVYTILASIMALSSALLQSQARYAMVLFPIYLMLAIAGRRAKVDQLIRVVFTVLFALLSALYAAHFTFALS